MSFEKRSACPNASERESPPTWNGLWFIFAPAYRGPRGKGVSSKGEHFTSIVDSYLFLGAYASALETRLPRGTRLALS